jgi:DNA polymerase III epsilon subunit-like protein
MNVFDAARDQLLENGFTSGEDSIANPSNYTLFSAVRRANGMDPEDADVCYWNWKELREYLSVVWATLDRVATSRHGASIQATAWSYPAERNLSEVMELLNEAAEARPELEAVQAHRRPRAAMTGVNKPRGAIATTLGLLQETRSDTFASLIHEVAGAVPADSLNEDLLLHIESMLNAAVTPTDPVRRKASLSPVPKLLSSYFGEPQSEMQQAWTNFAGFLHHVSLNNGPEVSDTDLVGWLHGKIRVRDSKPRKPRAAAPAAVGIAPSTASATSAPTVNRAASSGVAAVAVSFSAIDVETANAQRASVCAIAVVHVNNGRVTGRHKWLAQPPAGYQEFHGINVGIHGIHASDVANEPPFASVIPEIASMLKGRLVVAHNASFDVSALRLACLASGAEVPEFEYTCTMSLCRAALKMPSYKLPLCAEALSVEMGKHHDPLADAEASALIALALMRSKNVNSLEELLDTFHQRWGRLTKIDWMSDGSSRKPSGPATNTSADHSSPLYGRGVVITGDLGYMTRREAFDRIVELGGVRQTTVGQRTHILVVGDFNPATLLPGETGSASTRKAFELQAGGQQIEVMSGYDFLPMLD